MMIGIDPKIKKKKPEGYFNLDEDLTQEWIEEHQAFLVQEMRQKIEKKFQKENEKLVADGQREMKATELEERLQAANELEEKYETENKTKKVKPEGKGATLEKMEESITKLDQRIETLLVQAEDKESNKEVALGTSKIVSLWIGYLSKALLTTTLELYRSSTHSCLLQEIWCSNR